MVDKLVWLYLVNPIYVLLLSSFVLNLWKFKWKISAYKGLWMWHAIKFSKKKIRNDWYGCIANVTAKRMVQEQTIIGIFLSTFQNLKDAVLVNRVSPKKNIVGCMPLGIKLKGVKIYIYIWNPLLPYRPAPESCVSDYLFSGQSAYYVCVLVSITRNVTWAKSCSFVEIL